jgi:hypothetical protein
MRKETFCLPVFVFFQAWGLLTVAHAAEPGHDAMLEQNPSPSAPSVHQPAADWNPCPDSLAEEGGRAPTDGQQWTATFAPYVYHWKPDPEHRYAFAFALERNVTQQRFCGLSLFRNSFGQPSAYLYAGRSWDNFWGNPRLSARVTVGVIYGYVGEYHGKVPFNWNGFSPTVIPALAYRFNAQDSIDVSILGTAGLVFGLSHRF